MSKKLSIITLILFAAGIIVGFIFPNFSTSISFIGTIYINLLKIMIVPVLFFDIIKALTHNTNITKLTIKTIVLFIIMFIVSFLLCSGLWQIIKPGTLIAFEAVNWEGELVAANLSTFLTNLVPSNILDAMMKNSILPVILFSFFFGIVLNKVDSKRIVIDNINVLSTTFNKMLHYIMYLTPIGVFALISNTAATFGTAIISGSLLYIGCAYLGCIVVALLVMILPVWIICKINPIEYIKKVYKVWLITLSTCSSAATLPTTMEVCNKEFGVPENITNLVVPLGCTIHMCGGAVSFSLLAMLNLQMLNIPITFSLFILMIVVALLINMGAPGLPGGGIIIGATYLSILGLPLTFIGFYAGIYRLLDMSYTTMNVCGDISANLILAKVHNEKNT